MTEPTTEAGRRLYAANTSTYAVGRVVTDFTLADAILAIEAEARAALLAELEAGVEGLRHPESQSYDQMTRDGALRDVLDLIRKAATDTPVSRRRG